MVDLSDTAECQGPKGIILVNREYIRFQAVAVLLLFSLPTVTALAELNPPRPITLMTYNVHGWRDSSHSCNFDRIVKVVKDAKPEILCLNEVLHPFARPPTPSRQVNDYYQRVQDNKGRDHPVDPSFLASDTNLSFLHRLAEATGLTKLDFLEATDNSYFGQGVSFGNAILTCHPIVETCHVLLEVAKGDENLGRQQRDFVDPRSFGAAQVKIDNQHTIGVAYGHLDHKSEELREKQILMALQNLQPFLEKTPHIVCGDFNTFQKSDCDEAGWHAILDLYHSRGWPEPPERSLVLDALIKEGYSDTFYQQDRNMPVGVPPKPTSWTNNPLMRIDHIYTKQATSRSEDYCTEIVTKRHYRIDADASDHFPVVLEALLLPGS